jgi:L,D-peptidoglycan transpeptidase YkuD (ErfK/YbiS/YcfS/YnhG family)
MFPVAMTRARIIRAAASALAAAGLVAGLVSSVPATVASAAIITPQQWIHVTAPSYISTYATFTAWQLESGRWVRVLGPWTARVGYHGIAPPGRKREGDGRTPSGTYGLPFLFGVYSRPSGVAWPWCAPGGFSRCWRHAYRFDVWDDDPASARYNTWCNVTYRPCGAAPEPLHQVPVYDYAAVIGYNLARIPGLGSAIFLHVGNGGSTAGCVSLPVTELLRVLRWLRPGSDPQITIRG